MTGYRIAYGNSVLLARSLDMDTDSEIRWMAEIIDTATLLVCTMCPHIMFIYILNSVIFSCVNAQCKSV